VLFDIDGTLIRRAGPHHREALVDAVRQVTGLRTTTDHIPVHGMLDPDILTRMMRDARATPAQIRLAMPAIIEAAQTLYVQRCPDLSGKVCPGVRTLLDRLERASEVLVLGMPDGPPVPVLCMRDNRLDPLEWKQATAGLPELAEPRLVPWEDVPRTATWKVQRVEFREKLLGKESGPGTGRWT